ncbi:MULTISPECIES: molybdenum cofactor guanylyltransferase [Micromonospora]|uniref:molybdenum cofactor guanylyltransferase n=1 Tax=Micromonospora TaxID=1873 RepID=UPI0035A222D6
MDGRTVDGGTVGGGGGYAAVVLAGGAARRMGGVDKPRVPVGGRPMLDRVLAAVADADERVLVGPTPGDADPRVLVGPTPADADPPALTDARVLVGPEPVRSGAGLVGVRVTREKPAGGGPVAAAAAGLALLDPGTRIVALLAADLPLLTPAAVAGLVRRLAEAPADGVCYVDADGRRQSLCGVWRVASLRAALDRLAGQRDGRLDGAPVRALLAGLTIVDLPWSGTGPPPWFDCDTDDDVRRAEEWTR